MVSESKENVIRSSLWAYGGQIGYIVIGLLGNIILARKLNPDSFGIVGISMFFVSIGGVLVESGLGGALIRKQDASDKDYTTMFIFNICISAIIFVAMFSLSGIVAEYYKIDSLKIILQCLSLIILLNAVSIVQNVKLIKRMQFKVMGIYRMISITVATFISIICAYKGFGVWSIVILQILNAGIYSFCLWVQDMKIGSLVFSKTSFREMISFGIYTTGTSILITVFENIYQLILGRFFSITQVGYFYQAKRLQDSLDASSKNVIHGAIYAHLCKYQDDNAKLFSQHMRIAKVFTIIMTLITLLIFLYSKEIIIILYGQKWLSSVKFLQLLTISSLFIILETVFSNIFRVFNKVGKSLVIEIIKKIFQLATIGLGIYLGSIEILLVGFLVTCIIGFLLMFIMSAKLIDVKDFAFVKNFLLISCIGLVLGFGFNEINIFAQNSNVIIRLAVSIPVIIIYGGILLLFKVFRIEGRKLIF